MPHLKSVSYRKNITWDRTQWRVISVPSHLGVNKHRVASGTIYLMTALSFLYVFTNRTAKNENSEGTRNSSRKTDDLFCFQGSPRPPETKNTQADTRTHSRDWSQIKCFSLKKKKVTSIINICVWRNYCNGLTNALEKKRVLGVKSYHSGERLLNLPEAFASLSYLSVSWFHVWESQGHKITDLFRLEGTSGVSKPIFCPKQSQLQDQTRVLRALSRWVLKTCKDGDCTVFLGFCSTAWLSSWESSFSLYVRLSCFNLCPLLCLPTTHYH